MTRSCPHTGRSAPTALLVSSSPRSSSETPTHSLFVPEILQSWRREEGESAPRSEHVCWGTQDSSGTGDTGAHHPHRDMSGPLERRRVGCRWYLQQPLLWADKATPKPSKTQHTPLLSHPSESLCPADVGAVPLACPAAGKASAGSDHPPAHPEQPTRLPRGQPRNSRTGIIPCLPPAAFLQDWELPWVLFEGKKDL